MGRWVQEGGDEGGRGRPEESRRRGEPRAQSPSGAGRNKCPWRGLGRHEPSGRSHRPARSSPAVATCRSARSLQAFRRKGCVHGHGPGRGGAEPWGAGGGGRDTCENANKSLPPPPRPPTRWEAPPPPGASWGSSPAPGRRSARRTQRFPHEHVCGHESCLLRDRTSDAQLDPPATRP